MKKLLALLLAALLVLPLIACTTDPEVSQQIDETTAQRIREDYINLTRYLEGDAALLTLRIYAVFEDAVVLFADAAWVEHDPRPATEMVAEFVFNYPDSRALRVYRQRRFYHLEDSYEDGDLTLDQIRTVWNLWRQDRYVTVPPSERSWKMGDPSLVDPVNTDGNVVDGNGTQNTSDPVEPPVAEVPYVEPTESVFYEVSEARSPDLPARRREQVDRFLEQYRKLTPMTEELWLEVESCWGSAGFSYGLSVRYDYYGVYHGYAVFRKPLDRSREIREVSLAGQTFRWWGGFEFVAYRDGSFYSLASLCEQGIFREEDVAALAAYHEALFPQDVPLLSPLSDEDLAEIGSRAANPEAMMEKLRNGYLGTYEGYVVYFNNGMLDWMTSQYIAGCYFYGSDLGVGAYKDGKFFSLADLYKMGKISRSSVEAIFAQYNRDGIVVCLPLLDPLPEERKTEIETEFRKQTGRSLSLHEIDYYGTYGDVVCFFARTDQNDENPLSGVYGYKNGIFLPLDEVIFSGGRYTPFRMEFLDLMDVHARHYANQFGVIR